MSETRFTPGPWQTNCSHIYAPDGAIIAQVHNPGSKSTDYPLVANRDLMATAPELYRVLANAVAQYDAIKGGPIIGALEAARPILAKARGDPHNSKTEGNDRT